MTLITQTFQQAASRILVGEVPNHWLYNPNPPSYDLTRPPAPHFPPPSPGTVINLSTTTEPILISPDHTALVIVDMQNLFLSPFLGAAPDSPANVAKKVLLETAIPSVRKAGIRIAWLNWGFTDEELETVPPSVVKAFGIGKKQREFVDWDAASSSELSVGAPTEILEGLDVLNGSEKTFLPIRPSDGVRRRTEGLAFDIGRVDLGEGKAVEGGRMLMRDTWNMELPPDLDRVYKEGLKLADKPDLWIHKNRMSGFWAGNQQAVEVLKEVGIKTLLFAGTKTDMCVVASLLDAWHAGFDVILLEDACGTTSPDYVSQAVSFNCARIWGFVSHSTDLERGVDQMLEPS